MCVIVGKGNRTCIELKVNRNKITIIPIYLAIGNWTEEYEILYERMVEVKEGNVLIIGDLNGRIGERGCRRMINNIELREERRSKDKVTNKNGILKVVNGISNSDSEGEYTFMNTNGQSVIDLCLASEKVIDKIKDF